MSEMSEMDIHNSRRALYDLLEGAAELVFVHPGHFAHWFVLHSYLSFITFCVETASTWRKSSFHSADPSSFRETTTLGISAISPRFFVKSRSASNSSSSPAAVGSRGITSRRGESSASANGHSTSS